MLLSFLFILCKAQQDSVCACFAPCNSIVANGGFEGSVDVIQGSPNFQMSNTGAVALDCWGVVSGSPHLYDKDNTDFYGFPFSAQENGEIIYNITTWNNTPENNQAICLVGTEAASSELLDPFPADALYQLKFKYALVTNTTNMVARIGFSENFIPGNDPWSNPNMFIQQFDLSYGGFDDDGFNVWFDVISNVTNLSGEDFNYIYISRLGSAVVFFDDITLIPTNLVDAPEQPLTQNQVQGDSLFHVCENDTLFLEVLPSVDCPVFWSVMELLPNTENPSVTDTIFNTISTGPSLSITPTEDTLTYFLSAYGCGSWTFDVVLAPSPDLTVIIENSYEDPCVGSIVVSNDSLDISDWTFDWFMDSTLFEEDTAEVDSLCPGNYTLAVATEYSCADTLEFAVGVESLPEYEVVVTQNYCTDGQCNGSIAISSDLSFEVEWVDGDVGGETDPEITGICNGQYQAVLSFAGLPDFSIVVEVDEPLMVVEPFYTTPTGISDQVLVVEGNMTIASDVSIVNCTIYMNHNKSLVVEQLGELTASNSVFTSACPNLYWAGIEVYGNENLPQDVPDAQGKATFSNNCLIEKALVGLRSGNIYFLFPDNPFLHWTIGSGGAHIECENTTFRNNERDLYFAHYPNFVNESVFTNCNFETNQNFILTDAIGYQHPMHNRATLVSNRLVTFQNCKFRNYSVALLNSFPDVSAIYAQNSNFSFLGSANSPHAAILEGFPRGIYSFGTFSGPEMNVLEYVTFRCYRGAYYRDLLTASITGNRFYELSSSTIAPFPDVPQGYLDDDPDNTYINEFDVVQNTFMPFCKGSYGLYLDYPVAFILTENLFRLAGPPNMLRVGLYVNGNDMHPNDVYKNTFANMTAGCRFYNDNRGPNPFTGLTYQCNTFIDNERNVEINNQPGFPGTTDFGVRTQVGTLDVSSGNEMDQNTIDLDDQDNIANYTGNAHTYYYYGSELATDETFDINLVAADQNNACGSLSNPNTNSSINSLISDYLDAKEDYFEYIDAGNTNGTLTEIQLAQYTNALELYYELIGISPALSEEALLAAISKAGDIPPILLAGILASNPIAAKSTTIQKSLDNMAIPLSEYQRTMINQGIYVVGLRESMDATLGDLVTKLNTATLKEYKRIQDEENPSTHAILIDDLTLLRSDQEAAYFRINWLINQKRFSEAKSLIAAVSSVQPDLKAEKLDYEAVEDLLTLFEELQLSPRPITSAEESALESQIDPRKPNCTRLALYILCNQGLINYKEPLVYSDQFGVARSFVESQNNTDTDIYTVFPNPAKNFVQLSTNEKRSLMNCRIEIADISGRKVHQSAEFKDSIQETFIDISGLEVGNYFLTVYNNGTAIYTKQFFKE
jgi:tetratricopeptide (TPR) repeat protein